MRNADEKCRPPRVAAAFLRLLTRRVSPPNCQEAVKLGRDRGRNAGRHIHDSLAELFVLRARRHGAWPARVWYWRQVLGFVLRARSLRRNPALQGRALRAAASLEAAGQRRAGTLVDIVEHAFRGLRRAPFLAVTVVLTLALGIGANAAVFSVVNSTLLNPFPYAGGDRIVWVWQLLPERGFSIALPFERAMELRERSRTLERVEVFDTTDAVLGGGDDELTVRLALTTPGLMDALHLEPRLGRHFIASDADPAADEVVLLSEGVWRRRFGGSAGVVGQVINLNGRPVVVVGVVDTSIDYLRRDVDVWVPMREAPTSAGWLMVLAWRREGVSIERARAEMEGLAFDDERYGRTIAALREPASLVGEETHALLYAALAAVSLVLLIACVNVANLMVTRGSQRRGELAVRAALGAGRHRIATELLVESAVMAIAGGLAGMLLASWCIDALVAVRPESLAIDVDGIRVDLTVFAYAAGLTSLAAVFAGLLPIVDLRRWQPVAAMRGGGSATVARGSRGIMRQCLLVGEVALSVMLLVGAGLLTYSLVRLQRVDPGYAAAELYDVSLQVRAPLSEADTLLAARLDEILRIVGGSGARRTATLATAGPVHDLVFSGTIQLEGAEEVHPRVRSALTAVAPGYFGVLGIEILEGRDFRQQDAASEEALVIVNRTFAQRYFATSAAVGKTFLRHRDGTGTAYRIIGVVDDALQADPLERDYETQIYWPLWDFKLRPSTAGGASPMLPLSLLLRADAAPSGRLDALALQLRPLGVELDSERIDAVDDRLRSALAGPRFNALLFAAFALIAIVLTSVGLYGVVSHNVQRRLRELGIRLALGAGIGQVRRFVIVRALLPVAAGVVIGLSGATAASSVISGILYLVEPREPVVFALVCVVVLSVAVAAVWGPARRATRIDPVDVLRAE